MEFSKALGVTPGITALIGSGGKTSLQNRLAAELRARGFKLEDRRYTPHLTLAREVRGEAEPKLVLPEPVPALVRGASLMLSERRQGVLTYTPLLFCGFAR